MNPRDTVTITRLEQVNARALDNINELLPQLAADIPHLNLAGLTAIVQSPANTVYAAVNSDGSVIGMLIVVTVRQFAGMKCWIEDVVVSKDYRGQGIARKLLEKAISEVPGTTRFINLTSNPRREAAHHLYTSLGFRPRDTVVFRRIPTQSNTIKEK
jgi:GNAT superfamily N-acetyltransferase